MFKKIIPFILLLALLPSIAEAGLFAGPDVRYSSPIWSKDGSRIYYIKMVVHWETVFLNLGDLSPERTTKLECYIMSMLPDGSGKKVVTKFITKQGYLEDIYNLVISPDDNELVFFLWNLEKGGKETGIYKINVDGKNLKELVSLVGVTNAPRLFISPDGTKIAYSRDRYVVPPDVDTIGDVFSSWLMDADGKNNHMICGEESRVEGWTTNGYLMISAYADSEGNAKLKHDNKGDDIVYSINVTDRTLIYDPASKKFIKNLPNYFSEERIKSLGFTEYDSSISPDGQKKLFSYDVSIRIIGIDGKNEKILLKGYEHGD